MYIISKIVIFWCLLGQLFITALHTECIPKGGIWPRVTTCIDESKTTNAFIAEYSCPVFEYTDSLLDIQFSFSDAYVEYGHYQKFNWIQIGPPEDQLVSSIYFIAHFDSDAKLDCSFRWSNWKEHYPVFYKWYIKNSYYISNQDLNAGCGAIGTRIVEASAIPDTLSFVIRHNSKYYVQQGIEPPKIDYLHDTIGVLTFVKIKP